MQKLEKIVLQLSDIWGKINSQYQTGSVPVKIVRAYLNSELRKEINGIGKEVKELVTSTSQASDNFLHSNYQEAQLDKSKEIPECAYEVVESTTSDHVQNEPHNDYSIVDNTQVPAQEAKERYALVLR